MNYFAFLLLLITFKYRIEGKELSIFFINLAPFAPYSTYDNIIKNIIKADVELWTEINRKARPNEKNLSRPV